jgi:DNA-binding Lrp family transcriptional regulator
MEIDELTTLDKALINLLQKGLPICENPFQQVAEQLGSTEIMVIARIQAMLDSGLLTRFGPMFDAACFGGAFTLAAMAVPDDKFAQVTEIVNSFEQVAHNYHRDHQLNMWFVIGAEQASEIAEVIANIEQKTGITVLNMPKQEEFYVGLYLPV